MENTPDIVVIADEAKVKAELESLLTALGYDLEVFDEFPSPEAFQASGQFPDLLFLQVNPENFERAEQIVKAANQYRKTPVIYLTDNKEEVFFSRVKDTRPFGFITKPLDLGGIRRIVELALLYDAGTVRTGEDTVITTPFTFQESTAQGHETYFFTKVGNKLKKIAIDEVHYVEVEGKYSSIFLDGRKFNVKASLKELLEKFPSDRFVRVSRNYIVNLEFIDHIDTMQYLVKVADREIPISRTYKDELMNRISLL